MLSLQSLFLQTVALVNELPGSLVYHLVLLFALEAAAVAALGRWRQARDHESGRLAFGLTSIFVLQLASFAVAALSAAGILDPLILTPPLDRAVSALTIAAVIWLFGVPEPDRLADSIAAAAAFAGLIGLAVGGSLWTQEVAGGVQFFNGTPQETAWEIAQLALLAAGMVLLAVRRAPHWGLGEALLAILLFGHGIHYLFPFAEANVAGAERLARILALPLLTALAYRQPPLTAAPPAEMDEVEPAAPSAEVQPAPPDVAEEPARLRWALDPKAMVALMSLGLATTPEEMGQIVTMAVGRAFIADLTLLLAAPDTSGKVSIACAFNLIREKFLAPHFALPLGQMPELSSAFNRGEAARLTLARNEAELSFIVDAVEVERPGPALVVPLRADDGRILGAVLLVSPFAKREWSLEDQNMLMAIAESIVGALQTSEQVGRLQQEIAERDQRLQEAEAATRDALEANSQWAASHDETQSGVRRLETELDAARQAMERQRQDAEQLIAQLEAEHVAAAGGAQLAQEMDELRAKYEAAQALAAERDGLEGELGAARERLTRLAQFESDLEQSRQELQYQLAQNEQLTRELEGTRAELRRLTEQRAAPAPVPVSEAESQAVLTARRAVTAIQTKLDQSTGELAKARDELKAQARRLADLERDLDTARTGGEAAAPAAAGETRLMVSDLTQSMEVIASLSQDLRQPMSSIVGYSDLLMGESVGILGALQRKFLERIKASTERMGALLDDLIRVTALDSGKLELTRETLDVVKVVEDAILGVGAQFREKGINLRLNIDDDIPPVTADRDAVRQILGHLLNNAGSASAIDGDVTLTVQRETEQLRGSDPLQFLFISVADSGGGIAVEDQPRVFSRLYRADAPLIAGLGDTGVGLSISKALVEAHAGRIWVNSEIGQGSTFCVLLPVESAPAAVPGNGSGPGPH